MSTATVTQPRSGAQATLMENIDRPAGQQQLVRVSAGAIEGRVEPITDPQMLRRQLEALMDQFNIIAPPVQVIGGFAAGYTMVASVVKINAEINDDGQGPETYLDRGFMKSHQRALNRVGLARIATAAGVKWTPTCGRRDDETKPNYWAFAAEGLIDTPDGQYSVLTGNVEVDLRDGSAQIGGWTPQAWAALVKENERRRGDDQVKSIAGWTDRRVMQARQRGLALAETKAKNRAIRSIGVQQVYTVKELEKPFIIFRAMYQPDMSDPVIRQMVAARALHGRSMLYPSTMGVQAQQLVAAPHPPAGTIETAAVVAQPTEAETPPVFVTGVKELGTQGGETVCEVSFSDGKKTRTADAGLIDGANKALNGKLAIEYSATPSERVPGVLVLIELGPARKGDDSYF
jgi:hypothetical protein